MKLIALMLDVEQHELEMVEAMTKETLSEPPMLLDGDRLLVVQPFAHEMRPGKSESQKGQKLGDTLVVLEMAGLEIEASGLQSGEKGFDLPALGVVGQSMLGFGVGGDNQVVILKFDADKREPVPIDPAALGKELCLTDAQVLEVLAGVTGSTLGADECVVLDADVKGQLGGFEGFEPACADELPVGNHGGNLLWLDQLEETLQKRASLSTVGVARLSQEAPDDRKGDASIGDREHQDIQDIDVETPQLPVATVDGNDQVLLLGQQRQHQSSTVLSVEAEVGKEALDTAVIGVRRDVGIEHHGKLAEGHSTNLDERKDKGGRKGESGSVPGELGLQDVEESFSLGHKAASYLGLGLRNPSKPSPGAAFLCFVVYLGRPKRYRVS